MQTNKNKTTICECQIHYSVYGQRKNCNAHKFKDFEDKEVYISSEITVTEIEMEKKRYEETLGYAGKRNTKNKTKN